MRIKLVIVLLAVITLWLSFSACFTVDRAEFVYLTQFGRYVATFDGRTDAGLHLKWPWPIQSVQRLDNRLQFFDLREVELLTRDAKGKTIDKTLVIGAYVCWRIAGKDEQEKAGADQFVRAVSTPRQAETILEQRILSKLGAEVGKLSLDDLINASPDARIDERMDQLRKRLIGPDGGLKKLARDEYGIDLVDIRLRRYNHPVSVRNAIYERTRSEREKKVADYTGQGDKLAAEITSKADREAADIKTEAASQAKKLTEEAAVKADAIRNQAQSQDPEFYTFLQKLETYKGMLKEGRDVLWLSSKHELFDMLLKPPRNGESMKPEYKPPAEPRPMTQEPKGPDPAPKTGGQ